ncbi:DUF397 domain-containing protein [Streptomyces sp. SID11385]|uniref:DUF397 domain-containing protein n=1 Tax=Streptomyces sp. SID11385 TaxID=2706031 RepID=UPI0013CA8B2D|nr:DUF397 domain-containing protein [Streptomyces sp. SID11385]NEA43435.1 DUF397 domain-containing protein [Streptomyces sp. SID11385]
MSTSHAWQKSSFSGVGGENCIELRSTAPGSVHLRESTTPDTVVTTTSDNLRAFLLGVKAGEFDHLLD